jgi:hypothetical protein
MTDAVLLIVRYQTWIYAMLGLGAVFYFYGLAQARRRLGKTLFGLEKEAALQRQNRALAMLILLLAVAVSVAMMNNYIVPNVILPQATAAAAGGVPTAMPSPTPIRAQATGAPLVVDSSGCLNPQATLTDPAPNQQIAGSFEVRGTANIANFAFYTLQISGAHTNGAWVSLYVGNTPVTNGTLGSFDTSAFESGEYAFRIVVKDSTGNYPTPCAVPVRLVNLVADQTPAP